MRTHLHSAEVAHARDLRLVLRHAAANTELFDLFFTRVGGSVDGVRVRRFGCRGGILYVDEIELFVFRLRRAVMGFGGEDGDGPVAVLAKVFFTATG